MFFNCNGFYPQTTAAIGTVHSLWIDILIKDDPTDIVRLPRCEARVSQLG